MSEADPAPPPPDMDDGDAPAAPFRRLETTTTTTAALPAPAPRPRPPRLLAAEEAAAYCGMGRTSWLDLDQRGAVPAPIRLGRRLVLWDIRDLDLWIDLRCPGRFRFEEIKRLQRQLAPSQPPPNKRGRPSAAS